MTLLNVLLQSNAAAQSGWSSILFMVVIIAIFYFFMIRDNVITAGGIYGKIKEIGDVYMMIEVADKVSIRIDKTSVFASAEDAKQK